MLIGNASRRPNLEMVRRSKQALRGVHKRQASFVHRSAKPNGN